MDRELCDCSCFIVSETPHNNNNLKHTNYVKHVAPTRSKKEKWSNMPLEHILIVYFMNFL